MSQTFEEFHRERFGREYDGTGMYLVGDVHASWDAAIASQQAELTDLRKELSDAVWERQYHKNGYAKLETRLADAEAEIDKWQLFRAAAVADHARYEAVVRQVAESPLGCGSIEHTHAIDAARELLK